MSMTTKGIYLHHVCFLPAVVRRWTKQCKIIKVIAKRLRAGAADVSRYHASPTSKGIRIFLFV